MAPSVADFLREVPPFDRLEPALRERVAEAAGERAYRAGEEVLVEDGPPAEHFYVIRSGSMELLHEHEVVDVLASREAFGHPSLLSGMAPTFTVRGPARTPSASSSRATSRSRCSAVPRERASSR